jgi:hypothetical protein
MFVARTDPYINFDTTHVRNLSFMACSGYTKSGSHCTRNARQGETTCWQHAVEKKGLVVGNIHTFHTRDAALWETEYAATIDRKYAKRTRHFNTTIQGVPYHGDGTPPIFIIPRVRGASYKAVPLEGVTADEVLYAPISKGFPMQDVSSWSLGPIVGSGLCLVNAAFSKCVDIMHIEGGGVLDTRRKNFWRRARQPTHNVQLLNDEYMLIDNEKVGILEWLQANEAKWLEPWNEWRKHVAMASKGSFHWSPNTIAYHNGEHYLDFVSWKKSCYIAPSYELLPTTPVYRFLLSAWKEHRKVLGLVHPKGMSPHPEREITKQQIEELYNSPTEMTCQPFVVAGLLLGAKI